MTDLVPSDRAPALLVAPEVVIPDDAVIGAHVVIRAGVELGRGVVIEDAVVLGKVPAVGSRVDEPTGQARGHVARRRRGHRQPHHRQCRGHASGPGSTSATTSLVREGSRLGADSSIGHACTIGRDAVVGERVRMQGYCGLATGVVVEDDCFIGPMVIMLAGITMGARDQALARMIRHGARIGSAAQILTGVEVGARRSGRGRSRSSPATYLLASPWSAYLRGRSTQARLGSPPWTCP